jgi:hypothetical protein
MYPRLIAVVASLRSAHNVTQVFCLMERARLEKCPLWVAFGPKPEGTVTTFQPLG